MTIKPIETKYNGYRFRSRLEARWAVFFDAYGIKYQYEPEGFEVEGYRYLPDFYLPDFETFVEVKPSATLLKESTEKLAYMVDYQGPCSKLLILGQIPGHFHATSPFNPIPGFMQVYWHEGIGARGAFFCNGKLYNPKKTVWFAGGNTSAPDFPEIRLREELYTYMPIEEWDGKAHGFWSLNVDTTELQRCYDAARQARFEYGESPE